MQRLKQTKSDLDVLCPYSHHTEHLFDYTLTSSWPVDDYVNPTIQNVTPISPLTHAALLGDNVLVRELMMAGASVNFANSLGQTPLMAAVARVCSFYLVNIRICRSKIDKNQNFGKCIF